MRLNATELDLIRPISTRHFAEEDFLSEGHIYQFGIGRQGVTLRELVQTYMPPATVAWGLYAATALEAALCQRVLHASTFRRSG